MRIAATHVLQAKAALGMTRADDSPPSPGVHRPANDRIPATPVTQEYETSPFQVNLSLFWGFISGQFRRADWAGRASVLAMERGQKAVVSTWWNVASAYFQLLELDRNWICERIWLAQGVVATGGSSCERRRNVVVDVGSPSNWCTLGGSYSGSGEAHRAADNLISIPLGKNRAPVTRGKLLVEYPLLPVCRRVCLPPERRPDIII